MKGDKQKSVKGFGKSGHDFKPDQMMSRADRKIYIAVEQKMIGILKEKHSMTMLELAVAINKAMNHRFDGVLIWYIEGVQRDLEARKKIRRFFTSKREEIALAKA